MNKFQYAVILSFLLSNVCLYGQEDYLFNNHIYEEIAFPSVLQSSEFFKTDELLIVLDKTSDKVHVVNDDGISTMFQVGQSDVFSGFDVSDNYIYSGYYEEKVVRKYSTSGELLSTIYLDFTFNDFCVKRNSLVFYRSHLSEARQSTLIVTTLDGKKISEDFIYDFDDPHLSVYPDKRLIKCNDVVYYNPCNTGKVYQIEDDGSNLIFDVSISNSQEDKATEVGNFKQMVRNMDILSFTVIDDRLVMESSVTGHPYLYVFDKHNKMLRKVHKSTRLSGMSKFDIQHVIPTFVEDGYGYNLYSYKTYESWKNAVEDGAMDHMPSLLLDSQFLLHKFRLR